MQHLSSKNLGMRTSFRGYVSILNLRASLSSWNERADFKTLAIFMCFLLLFCDICKHYRKGKSHWQLHEHPKELWLILHSLTDEHRPTKLLLLLYVIELRLVLLLICERSNKHWFIVGGQSMVPVPLRSLHKT